MEEWVTCLVLPLLRTEPTHLYLMIFVCEESIQITTINKRNYIDRIDRYN